MLVSISDGFCLDGLFGAILFNEGVDILETLSKEYRRLAVEVFGSSDFDSRRERLWCALSERHHTPIG